MSTCRPPSTLRSAPPSISSSLIRVANALESTTSPPSRTTCAWEASQKQGLIQFLRSRDWTVVECPTEADVEIGKACGPNDVVVSGDSDLLMYDHINILWRPWRCGQFLQYTIPDILKALDLSRVK
ncbi:MAG: hypothetical protein J3Q66DRAFT_365799 [Benniella sp.]|nr:MAG: hypothetical protein J3Q66DRAFT_365799 [Benniella sp.]